MDRFKSNAVPSHSATNLMVVWLGMRFMAVRNRNLDHEPRCERWQGKVGQVGKVVFAGMGRWVWWQGWQFRRWRFPVLRVRAAGAPYEMESLFVLSLGVFNDSRQQLWIEIRRRHAFIGKRIQKKDDFFRRNMFSTGVLNRQIQLTVKGAITLGKKS